MNAHEEQMLSRLKSMPLEEARLAVARKEFGEPPDSPNYLFATGVLAAWESENRDDREEQSLSISRSALRISECANKIAISAMILSAAAVILSTAIIVMLS